MRRGRAGATAKLAKFHQQTGFPTRCMAPAPNPFNAHETWKVGANSYKIVNLKALETAGLCKLDDLPVSIKVLLESVVRNVDGEIIRDEDVKNAAKWTPTPPNVEIPFMPSRVLLQDFTGVPAVVDLAAMRDAITKVGGDPNKVNPLVPADLVIDHSVQVDVFGTIDAFAHNVDFEYQRNRERYVLLKWGQKAFENFRVVPPGMGICHQVNIEHLSQVVHDRKHNGERWAFPDTLVGMDSHTTMVGGIGVVGWGVGGIEAEAVMLGQPYFMKLPEVIGFRLVGDLPQGTTATDLVLMITEQLRKVGVVDKFVEFFGSGLRHLSAADRSTIANMAPEQGSTISFFPVDDITLDYLRTTGRTEAHVRFVEAYSKLNGLWAGGSPKFSHVVELDLSKVEPSLAGPSRPHDRVALKHVHTEFKEIVKKLVRQPEAIPVAGSTARSRLVGEGGHPFPGPQVLVRPQTEQKAATVVLPQGQHQIAHGDVVIAAITSCTNTSNPMVMVGAGLLAKKAVDLGLQTQPWVKTSLAPGSRVVTEYLKKAGLLPYLEKLGFGVVAYGCTTCIGNAGPLPPQIERAIQDEQLVVSAVLSGNRNFEARIHPLVRANYLASPPLVVAYALAGTMQKDLTTEPIGKAKDGKPVFLKDLWPSTQDIQAAIRKSIDPETYRSKYKEIFAGDERWQALQIPEGRTYKWDNASTYIRQPPYFESFRPRPEPLKDIQGARILAVFGDTITTDHISPAGAIDPKGEAGKWLLEHGVKKEDFNQFGARRGNHEVMIRGTFGNVRIKNLMVPGTEGSWAIHQPSGERMTVFAATERYRKEKVPLVVVAGSEYGTGSSRDWAAKGTMLMGVRAVIAKSFERIHRSNLIGMGVLPCEFLPGEDAKALGLDGTETIDLRGISKGLVPGARLDATATKPDGTKKAFKVVARLDAPAAVQYVREGGIMPAVLRKLVATKPAA
jgi:aconitate hydratase